ncbi:MAG: ABC transporter substrate-binding protein [Chloroflexi bacterium]|nr:MAG: ABC transporter substrate-binding protein [Chloroflexota bacterium]
MKRILSFGLALVVLVGFLPSCTPKVTPTQEVAPAEPATAVSTEVVPPTSVPEPTGPQGTLRVALPTEPSSLYIPTTPDKISDIAASQLYDPLVFQDDAGQIVACLAESWETSADGTVWTFHLRQGVTFHNGDPFTADDVVATWEYGTAATSSWPEKYNIAQSVVKVDDYTVTVTTDGPKPLLLVTMHDFWSIIPKKYMDEVGVDGFVQHPIGTGPFMFDEWVKGDHITYKANPNYWQEGLPKAAELVFRFIPESATRVAALQQDEVDIITRLSAEEADSLRNSSGVKVLQYQVPRIYYIAFDNLSSGIGTPIEDAKVRQAMNYAVDVDGIIKALFAGNGRRAAGYVASSELGYGIVQPFAYDPEKAKQLLAEAGFPNGFETSMACPSGVFAAFQEVCEAIVSNLGDVGITVDLQMMESGHFWDLMVQKQLPPLDGDSWADESGESYNRMAGALGGRNAGYSLWSDPEIDRILKAISTEIDVNKRKALYEEIQVYMQENPPFIYLYEPVTFEATRDRVTNYTPRPSEMLYLQGTGVTP